MADLKERICVLLKTRENCIGNKGNAIAAFGVNAIRRTRLLEWFSRFKLGESSVKDCERSGRPSTGRTDENVEKGNKIIKEGRRSTISEIAGNLGLLHRTCQRILREHAADLCEVCVSVAHRRAAREAIFGRCKHGCIILTRVIWPLVMSSFLGIKSQLRRHLF